MTLLQRAVFLPVLRRVRLVSRRLGNKGTVAMMAAITLVPLLIAMAVAIDFSRLANGRARLQNAVDNAALSGAGAYSTNSSGAQSRAIVSATSAFCSSAAAMPAGMALTGNGAQACTTSGNTGPTVSTQVGGYKAGTPGITPSACSTSNPVVAGVQCGFIVTVSAKATITSAIASAFGINTTISATAMAANPFINVGSNITVSINGSAYNTNSIWLYPLLLNANGYPDYTSNPGAIPGLASGYWPADASPNGCTSYTACGSAGTSAGLNCTSTAAGCSGSMPSTGCTDSPTQFTCGSYTMLANTYYNTSANPCNASAPCYPNGQGNYPTIIQGVVQNAQAPQTIMTATTLFGIAFLTQAGADQSYGYGGYQSNPANGCYYPGNAVYTTVAQVFGNSSNNISGGNPAMDWPKVSHWFYSSYLPNGYPPSLGEIVSQLYYLSSYTPPGGGSTIQYNTRIPSIGNNQSGAFSPTLASCAANASNGNSYDQFLTTSFPTSGKTNGSLFITSQPAGSSYIPPSQTGYAGQLYTPANTPGGQYAALSCQAYGNNIFTFYWNDMGGSQGYGDDLDYNNGTLRISCTGTSLVILIN